MGQIIRWLERRVGMWLIAAIACVGILLVQPADADASCCKGTTCTDDNLILCALSGGNWLPGPCIPLLTCAISGARRATSARYRTLKQLASRAVSSFAYV